MDRLTLSALSVAVLVSVGCVAGAAVSGMTGSFERDLPVTAPVDLTVVSGAGWVQIRPGETGHVHVIGRVHTYGVFWTGLDAEAQLKRLEASPPIEHDGNTVRIGETADRWLLEHVSISYELTVPVDTRVRSHSGSGSLTIEGVGGAVEARTGSGSIRIANAPGPVKASAGSGSIAVQGAGQGLDARAGSGGIQARDVEGAVTAWTGSGAITLEGRPTRDWSVSAGSGSVTVRVPPDAGFDVDAHAGSGGIRISHPVQLVNTARHQLQGRVQGGGPRVQIHTGSGSIQID